MQDPKQTTATPSSSESASRIKTSRWRLLGKWSLWIVGVLLVLYLWMLPPAPELENTDKTSVLNVTTLHVSPTQKTLPVNAQGVTHARWQQAVTANVTGRVQVLSEALIVGGFVKQGELLLQVAATSYRAELASAEAALAQAKLNLARYQHEQTVAKKVTQHQNLSAYGRFEPHINAAHAEVNAASARLALAQQQLNDTRQIAPFDAVILSKQVSPKLWVNQGDTLYTLAASTAVDVEVALPLMQWQQLHHPKHISATIHGFENHRWAARVRFISPILDSTTRQRSMTLTVEQPYQQAQPLLPNQVVKITLSGKQQQDTISAPASVLTEDGEVWTVQNNRLHKASVAILQQTMHQVTFRFNENPSEPRELVRFPLSSMLEGQRVTTSKTPVAMTKPQSSSNTQQPFLYSKKSANSIDSNSRSKH